MISHRERLLHRKKDDPSNQHLERSYKLFRNRINREIKKSKKKYYKEYFENNISNMKKTWQGIKQIINMNNKLGPKITQLNYKGKESIHVKSPRLVNQVSQILFILKYY